MSRLLLVDLLLVLGFFGCGFVFGVLVSILMFFDVPRRCFLVVLFENDVSLKVRC